MIAIEYPTITVGAHEDLVVRMSLASQILMRRARGIDVAKLGTLMLPKVEKTPIRMPSGTWSRYFLHGR